MAEQLLSLDRTTTKSSNTLLTHSFSHKTAIITSHTNSDGFIWLTDDGGVQKKIIVSGEEDTYPQTPPRFSTVQCHYIGRVMKTGKIFDTSRSIKSAKNGKKRNKRTEPTSSSSSQPFEFIVGSNQVIQGWDIGIQSMRRNEFCIMRCSPHYAYGSRGTDTGIPPNCWLEFEIELIAWNEWQNINNNPDLKKKVLHNGGGTNAISIKQNDLVTLSYKAFINVPSNEQLFDSSDKITVVCDDDDRFTEGFHIGLQSCVEGEHCIIDVLDYDLGYGAEGDCALNIPYFAEVVYELCIHSIQISKHIEDYSEKEKLDKAIDYKIEGNKLFAQQLFDGAIKKYKKSLQWVCYLGKQQNENKKSEIYAQKVQLLIDNNNNLCLIWLKRECYQKVIEYSAKVLEYDANNVKALSRSGLAKMKQNCLKDAKLDLKKAKSIDANNAYVNKLLCMVTAKMKHDKEKQRKQYHAMFGHRPTKTKGSKTK